MSNKNNLRRPPVEDGAAQPADAERRRGRRRPPERNVHDIREDAPPRRPVLRFSPTAWAKLAWFCLYGETEIGGFAVTDPADLLHVIDFVTVRQQADWASIKFDDVAVADFLDQQVDLGRRPEQFARVWAHTHPGDSPTPSAVDEECFARVFGSSDWAVMFVLARIGKTYARLRFNVGPGGQAEIPVQVDWLHPFAAADHAAWQVEYEANIVGSPVGPFAGRTTGIFDDHSMPGNKQRAARPIEPFGADKLVVADAVEFDEDWTDLLSTTEWADLDAAAETMAARWGLTDFADWTEAVVNLPLDRKTNFRLAVQALLLIFV